MRNSKLGLRALGLAILGAMSMMAFFAASAQAQLPGESKVGEFQINLAPALLATISGTQEKEPVGELLVEKRNLTISCEEGKLTNGKIDNPTDALVTVLFEKCIPWNFALTLKLPCTVLSPGEETGSIAAVALALPILHGPKNEEKYFVLFEPPTGELNFTEVELHGATCPLPLVNPVKGAISAEVLINHKAKPLITFSPAIQLLTGDSLTFGNMFVSYIDAEAEVELTGDHLNDELGVL